jgi:hypothetical protein
VRSRSSSPGWSSSIRPSVALEGSDAVVIRSAVELDQETLLAPEAVGLDPVIAE